MKTYKNVVEYISKQPKAVQAILKTVRAVIKKVAPKAEESISYGMPGYKLNGKPLVYFGAWKGHIGFYATPSGHQKFKKELAKYKSGKGSVNFPLGSPMPYPLITRIIKFRVRENKASAKGK